MSQQIKYINFIIKKVLYEINYNIILHKKN